MERERREEDAQGPPIDWERCDDAAVLAGMRRGWEAAYAEFCDRFLALLVEIARKNEVQPAERVRLATEFLDEAAFRLGTTVTTIPNTMASYLAAGFYHHLALAARREGRKQRRHDALLEPFGSTSELAVAELCSEYTIQSTHGADDAEAPEANDLVQTLRRGLVARLYARARPEDQRLLGYLREGMPPREIAPMLGITYGALRVRIMRLRARMRSLTTEYLNELGVEHGRLLARSLGAPGRSRRGEGDGKR